MPSGAKRLFFEFTHPHERLQHQRRQTGPPRLPITKALAIFASIPRWLILRELSMGEPLPVAELARRLRATSTGISKHCGVLLDSGIVYRGYGGLYAIDPRFLVPGERSIDLGFVLIRLDQMGQ